MAQDLAVDVNDLSQRLWNWVQHRPGRLPRERCRDDGEKALAIALREVLMLRAQGCLQDSQWEPFARIPGIDDAYRRAVQPPSFEESVQELCAWVDIHGVLPRFAHKASHTELCLAKFIHNQRVAHAKSLLPESRRESLLAAPGMEERLHQWDIRSDLKQRRFCQWTFEANVQELKRWIQQHRRLPRLKAKDLQERKHHHFLAEQRRAYIRHALSDERRDELLHLPGMRARFACWERPRRTRFDEHVRALKTWVASRGRLPRYYGGVTTREPTEKKLAKFLANLRQAHMASRSGRGIKRWGTLTEARRAQLAEIPGMAELLHRWRRRPSFEEQAASTERWITEHDGQVPNRRSADQDERRLAIFLDTHHRAEMAGHLAAWRRQRLLQIPAVRESRLWRAPQRRVRSTTHVDTSASRVDNISNQRGAAGITAMVAKDKGVSAQLCCKSESLGVPTHDGVRTPSTRPAMTDGTTNDGSTMNSRKEEHERVAEDVGARTVRRRLRSKTRCPSYPCSGFESRPSKIRRLHQSFIEQVEQLECWVGRHEGRLPRQGRHQDPNEQRLARFLNGQQQAFAKGALPEERRQRLMLVAPSLRQRLQCWEDQSQNSSKTYACWVDHLRTWVTQLGRLPKYGEGNEEERKLAQFLNHQRALIEESGAEADRKLSLLANVPGVCDQLQRWRQPRCAFAMRADELETWMQERSGALPKTNVADPQERRLANFFRKQADLSSQGLLAVEHRKRLARIPGMPPHLGRQRQPRGERFEARVRELEEWLGRPGGSLPKQRSADAAEVALASFLNRQQQLSRKGALAPEHRQRLQQVQGLATKLKWLA